MALLQQSFNKKTNAWVKSKKYANGGCSIVDVKQRLPQVPFKNVPIVGKRKKIKVVFTNK